MNTHADNNSVNSSTTVRDTNENLVIQIVSEKMATPKDAKDNIGNLLCTYYPEFFAPLKTLNQPPNENPRNLCILAKERNKAEVTSAKNMPGGSPRRRTRSAPESKYGQDKSKNNEQTMQSPKKYSSLKLDKRQIVRSPAKSGSGVTKSLIREKGKKEKGRVFQMDQMEILETSKKLGSSSTSKIIKASTIQPQRKFQKRACKTYQKMAMLPEKVAIESETRRKSKGRAEERGKFAKFNPKRRKQMLAKRLTKVSMSKYVNKNATLKAGEEQMSRSRKWRKFKNKIVTVGAQMQQVQSRSKEDITTMPVLELQSAKIQGIVTRSQGSTQTKKGFILPKTGSDARGICQRYTESSISIKQSNVNSKEIRGRPVHVRKLAYEINMGFKRIANKRYSFRPSVGPAENAGVVKKGNENQNHLMDDFENEKPMQRNKGVNKKQPKIKCPKKHEIRQRAYNLRERRPNCSSADKRIDSKGINIEPGHMRLQSTNHSPSSSRANSTPYKSKAEKAISSNLSNCPSIEPCSANIQNSKHLADARKKTEVTATLPATAKAPPANAKNSSRGNPTSKSTNSQTGNRCKICNEIYPNSQTWYNHYLSDCLQSGVNKRESENIATEQVVSPEISNTPNPITSSSNMPYNFHKIDRASKFDVPHSQSRSFLHYLKLRKHWCCKCDKMFICENLLQEHVRLEHKESYFPCRYCDTFKFSAMALHFHYGTCKKIAERRRRILKSNWKGLGVYSLDMLPVKCEFCNSVVTVDQLTMHYKKVHKVTEDQFRCVLCDKGFENRAAWITHVEEWHQKRVEQLALLASKLNVVNREGLVVHPVTRGNLNGESSGRRKIALTTTPVEPGSCKRIKRENETVCEED